jgi:hypothetical protein
MTRIPGPHARQDLRSGGDIGVRKTPVEMPLARRGQDSVEASGEQEWNRVVQEGVVPLIW